MKKLILRLLIFAVILGVIIFKIDKYFVQETNAFKTFNFLYEEEQIDVLFLGNSHSEFGVNTDIINATSNVKSYNLSVEGISFFQIYYNLLEALKCHKPKLVAIENFPILTPDQDQNFLDNDGVMNVRNFNSIYAKTFGVAKYQEVSIAYPNDKLLNGFNIFKRHENWEDLTQFSKILKNYSSKEYKKEYNDYVRNFSFLSSDKVVKYRNGFIKGHEEIDISKDEILFIDKIINLSYEYDFKIIFYTLPLYKEYYEKHKSNYIFAHKKLQNLTKNTTNIEHLNMNEKVSFYDTYFSNDKVGHNQHLNYKGQIKASLYLAKHLKSNYFTDYKSKKANSPEDIAYSNKPIELDSTFVGRIFKINGKVMEGNEYVLKKDDEFLTIEGWMHKKGNYNNDSNKFIVLKKDESFIYLNTPFQIQTTNLEHLVKQFGDEYEKCGYKFKMKSKLLEKGRYKIFHMIKSENGGYFIRGFNKTILVQ